MFLAQLWPELARRLDQSPEPFFIRTIKIAGLTEVGVASRLGDLLSRRPPLTCGIYAKPGEVHLKIMSKATTAARARQAVFPVERFLRRIFGKQIFGVDDQTLPAVLVDLLSKKRQTIALAESCTGGLASHLLTEVPGSSKVLMGGIIAYDNSVKKNLLGVDSKALSRWGAVSPQVARQMADGIRKRTGASIGIAITGIAGPSGGSPKKPVGLVYLALSQASYSTVSTCRFGGQRTDIKIKSALAALDLARKRLLR